MRRGGLALWLWAGASFGHGLNLELSSPVGIGPPPSDGRAVLSWKNNTPDETATLKVFVTSGPLSNTDSPYDLAVSLTVVDGPLLGTQGQASWNTQGVAPGCYQPFALVQQGGDVSYSPGPGKVTVSGPGFVPPAVWMTNRPEDAVDATGHFEVRFRVIDPDSPTTVSLRHGDGTYEEVFAQGLVFPKGTVEGHYRMDVSRLPVGYYDLAAEVKADNEPGCTAYWQSVLYVPGGPYQADTGDGGDAGVAAPATPGPADGGGAPPTVLPVPTPDSAEDAGGPPRSSKPRGCGGKSGASALALLAVYWARASRGPGRASRAP